MTARSRASNALDVPLHDGLAEAALVHERPVALLHGGLDPLRDRVVPAQVVRPVPIGVGMVLPGYLVRDGICARVELPSPRRHGVQPRSRGSTSPIVDDALRLALAVDRIPNLVHGRLEDFDRRGRSELDDHLLLLG